MRSWILTKKSNSPISPITRAKAKRTDGVFSFFEVENNNRLGYIVKLRRNIKKKVLKVSMGQIILGPN